MCEHLSHSLPVPAPPCIFSSFFSSSNWVVNAICLGAGHAVKPRFPEGQVVIILFLQCPWIDRGVSAGWGRMLGGRGPRRRIALEINIGHLLSSVPVVPGRGEPRHLRPALQRWLQRRLQEDARWASSDGWQAREPARSHRKHREPLCPALLLCSWAA